MILRKQNSLEYFSPSYLWQIPLVVPDLFCYVSSDNLTLKCGQFCFEVSCHHIRKATSRPVRRRQKIIIQRKSALEFLLLNVFFSQCTELHLKPVLICNLFVCFFFAFSESYPIGCGRVQCVYLCLWADRLWQNISF